MKDYVSRDYLLGEYDRQHQGPPGGARKIIAEAPAADVVEVVRCCECIYHDDESQYHYCHKWGRNCPNDSDFFCKWGKRKEGGQHDV